MGGPHFVYLYDRNIRDRQNNTVCPYNMFRFVNGVFVYNKNINTFFFLFYITLFNRFIGDVREKFCENKHYIVYELLFVFLVRDFLNGTENKIKSNTFIYKYIRMAR